jgi:hypothetical protein
MAVATVDGEAAMADEDHVETLHKARAQMVAGRRRAAGILAEKYDVSSTPAEIKRFIDAQGAIEAIDKAIKDEESRIPKYVDRGR